MILTPVHLMRSAMQALQINPADDVASMIDGVAAGDAVAIGARTVIARDAIPRGHKIALGAIADGADIIKYGVRIGHATQTMAAGAHVHTHNLATNLAGALDYRYRPGASGAQTAAERNGEREIALWKRGATL